MKKSMGTFSEAELRTTVYFVNCSPPLYRPITQQNGSFQTKTNNPWDDLLRWNHSGVSGSQRLLFFSRPLESLILRVSGKQGVIFLGSYFSKWIPHYYAYLVMDYLQYFIQYFFLISRDVCRCRFKLTWLHISPYDTHIWWNSYFSQDEITYLIGYYYLSHRTR